MQGEHRINSKVMKKTFEIILGLIVLAAVFLAGAQNPDGSCNLAWTFSCLAVAVVSGALWWKLHPKPIHITDEAYIELQRQIQDAVDEMDNNEHRKIEIEAELPDDAAIYLTIEMSSHISKSKFVDDAWGADRIFTETNWECNCEITKIQVFDGNGKLRESDFDSSNLELEFDTTDWN